MSIEICSKMGNKTKSKTTPPHTLETVGPFTIERESERKFKKSRRREEETRRKKGKVKKEGETLAFQAIPLIFLCISC